MSNEVDQAPELVLGQDDGTFEAWIDFCKHRLYRTEPVGQVVRKTGSDGIVAACGSRSIQVMADCIIQSSECAIALLMGLRRGEVAGLRWSEIDFNEGMLHVRTALQRIPGKGLQLQGVKSQKSHRHSPMPALCIAALQRRRQMQLEEKRAAGTKWKQDSDFVFTSRYGARIVIEELTRELDKALELAKLPHLRFHDLRHSTASLLIAKGVPLKFVQEILGHANFQITADLYTHLLPSQLRDAAQTMNDIFEKPDVAPDGAPTTRQPIQ